MKVLILVVLATALLQMTTAQSAELDIKEGLYQITIQTEMPGMPMPPQNVSQCITQADKNNPQHIIEKANHNADCLTENIQQSPGKLSFTLSCPKESMTGRGEYLFSGSAYSGTMNMSMPNPQGGQPMTMTAKTTAKLVGPCKK